jgi:hypothetical protein
MGKIIIIFLFSCIIIFSASGQEMKQTDDSLLIKKWAFTGIANLNILKDDFFVTPVARADRGRLHLEGRYNYEDRNTTSLWAGMNFHFGEILMVDATTMAGVVFGNSDGVAPGMLLSIVYKRLQLYGEGEYFISLNDINPNYAFLWTDLSYALTNWLSVGISTQRTRLYQTARDVQFGVFSSFTFKHTNLTSYWYKNGQNSPGFILLALSHTF